MKRFKQTTAEKFEQIAIVLENNKTDDLALACFQVFRKCAVAAAKAVASELRTNTAVTALIKKADALSDIINADTDLAIIQSLWNDGRHEEALHTLFTERDNAYWSDDKEEFVFSNNPRSFKVEFVATHVQFRKMDGHKDVGLASLARIEDFDAMMEAATKVMNWVREGKKEE